MNGRRRLAGCALALGALMLAGCAAPARTQASAPGWSGRMALRVDGNASQSFSASFELRGSAQAGELTLFTPLGGRAGQIQWSPGRAVLEMNGETRQFDSLDALSSQATGAPIPVAALFDWLSGVATTIPGWETDLARASEGRISAKRNAPAPAVDLRVVLER